ncbi:MAG: alanyl-tRNA editing protein [Alphaproteobacteria bacterium]|nr:alanyl-tRNA editing protein [Alphaproteobacteria bacterium]
MTDELFREDSYLRECEATVTASAAGLVVLDRTVFYPTGGGQPGDTGVLALPDGTEIAVLDTVKDEGGAIVHAIAEGAAPPAPGTKVSARIDWDRRHRHMRMHSLLHLVCAVVPCRITGAQVGAAKSRIDFDTGETVLDKAEIAQALNRLVAEDRALSHRWIRDDELDASPELVRTMSVQPPRGSGRVRLMEVAGADLQPCGGTHVSHTGEIGRVAVAKIENKGKRNRRVNVVLVE